MKHINHYTSYQATHAFSKLAMDYHSQAPNLSTFFEFAPTYEGISQAIEKRKVHHTDRALLVNTLTQQYQHTLIDHQVATNIQRLQNSNTYTVCTAHQPNLLSGYLYFFYKILHTIKLAEELNTQYPDLHFVPVYYMGSEDNDLDELGQFYYEGTTYKWDGAGQKGAVGRMHTDSLKPLLEKLFKHLGPPGKNLDDLVLLLENSYLKHKTIADATRFFCNEVFGKYGLIVLNPDDAGFKKQMHAIFKDDLLQHNPFKLASSQTEKLSEHYKTQAYPRSINLFYLKDNLRERIEKQDSKWIVLNTDITFTEDALLQELEEHPERFSPNVILRGTLQETILPNICFIGGGAEIAYWLQLQSLFKHFNVFFPVLLLRQSAQLIPHTAQQLMRKIPITVDNLFYAQKDLMAQIITEAHGTQWQVSDEQNEFEVIFEKLKHKAQSIDTTLVASANATNAKIKKHIENLEHKIYKALERKENTKRAQITRLKQTLFIEKGLQERVENFMPYALQYGLDFFDEIKQHIEPVQSRFIIIELDNPNLSE